MIKTLNLVKNNIENLPNNIEAEQSIIGSILFNNEIFDEINMLINSKNFFDPMHQKIFLAIEKLIYSGMLASPITLKNQFENEKDDLNIPDYLIKITKFSTSLMFSFDANRAFFFDIKKFLAKPLLTLIISPIDPIFLRFSNSIIFIFYIRAKFKCCNYS